MPGEACLPEPAVGKYTGTNNQPLPSEQKKARYGSGLNLFLEENRGDMLIMLRCTSRVQ